jgi:hypothetical protein
MPILDSVVKDRLELIDTLEAHRILELMRLDIGASSKSGAIQVELDSGSVLKTF